MKFEKGIRYLISVIECYFNDRISSGTLVNSIQKKRDLEIIKSYGFKELIYNNDRQDPLKLNSWLTPDGKPLPKSVLKRVNKKKILPDTGFNEQPTSDLKELDKKVEYLRKIESLKEPKGNKKPAKTNRSSSVTERDPKVKAWVLENAKGVCELCRALAPFTDKNDDPYLEHHHVVFLSDGGRILLITL